MREGGKQRDLVAAGDQIHNPEQDAGADYRDEEAGKASVGVKADQREEEIAQGGAYDAHNDIAHQGGVVVHQFARQPTDKRTADQGPKDGKKHDGCLLFEKFFYSRYNIL